MIIAIIVDGGFNGIALFKVTGIFITAGLIAGGSKALNEAIGDIGDTLATRTPSAAGTVVKAAGGAP